MKTILTGLVCAFVGFAANDTFAQFHHHTPYKAWSWNNLSTLSTLSYVSPNPVLWCWTGPAAALGCDIPANVSFNSTTSAAGWYPNIYVQPLQAGTMEVRKVSDNSLMLSVSFENCIVVGIATSGGATLQCSTVGSGDVQYASPLLTFGTTVNNFTFAFSGLSPGLTVGSGGFLSSWSADGAGSLSAGTVTLP